MSHSLPVTALLAQLAEKANNQQKLTIGEVMDFLQDRGFALLLAMFSLPMMFPLPYPPGFSSLISIPLFFFSLQMAMGRKTPWLPEKWLQKSLPATAIVSVIKSANPWLLKLEKYLTPRRERFADERAERAIGAFSLILTGCIMLPLSVLSNTIPGAGIAIMSLGLLERDGTVVLFGALVGVIGFLITIAALAVIFLVGTALF